MATLASFLGISDAAVTKVSIPATTASAVQTFYKHAILRFTSNGSYNIRVAAASSASVTAAAATDFTIPTNQIMDIELIGGQDSVYLYNPNASTIVVNIQPMSKS